MYAEEKAANTVTQPTKERRKEYKQVKKDNASTTQQVDRNEGNVRILDINRAKGKTDPNLSKEDEDEG